MNMIVAVIFFPAPTFKDLMHGIGREIITKSSRTLSPPARIVNTLTLTQRPCTEKSHVEFTGVH